LIFFRDIISLFSYVMKPTIVLNSMKFHRNIKILRKRANSAAWLEIPRPAENCGP